MKKSVLSWLMWLGVVSLASSTGVRAAGAGGDAQATNITRLLGEWREYWGTPGQTDVTYHDQYRISRSGDTTVKVTTINRDQLVEDERAQNGTLTFTQHTDAYLVRYSLALQPDNNWLIGTATTPKGVYPIRWERTSSGAAEAGSGASDATLASFLGEWSEQWGTPGQTDVTYHDQYRITRKDATTVKVTTINRDQLVEDERVVNDTLTFTQHTDAYLVRYSLTIQPDKNRLVGTATNPRGVFPIKWERTK